MTKIYCVNGKPLDIVKREAKALKKERGFKLGEAQAEIAKGYGMQSWQELTEATVEVDDEFVEHFTVTRRKGVDEVRFCAASLADLHEDGVFNEDEVPDLYYRYALEAGLEPGTVSHVFDLMEREEAEVRGTPVPFARKGQNGAEDFITAIEAAWDDQPGLLIGLLNDEGLFDLSTDVEPMEAEFEALLTLELRKHGHVLGDRILFNTMDGPEIDAVTDWTRRVFVHDIDDGLVVISNGAGSTEDLRSIITPKSRLDALTAEMEDELGSVAYTTQKGEIWLYDRVLGPIPSQDQAPEMSGCL
jgi:hypothetical protein